MAEEDQDDKTESPTAQRLDKSREEGQVAQSRELSTFVVLMVGGATLWATAPLIGAALAGVLTRALDFEPAVARDSAVVLTATATQWHDALMSILPFLLLVVFAALAAPMLLRGWLFSGSALLPKFSRINPVSGLKRMVSSQSLAELVKSLLKVGVLGGVAVWLLMASVDAFFGLAMEQPQAATRHMGDLIGRIVLTLSGTLIFVVALDVPYQLWSHSKKLRMTKEEVRREARESEGDPHVKARVRALQREAVRRRMMSEIPTADVVVTNPTHYAVALKYSDSMRAPRVVAKGADAIAANIRALAAEHRIPTLEAPPLARALYRHADLGEEIPATLYAAVAEVLAWVFQLRHHLAAGGPAPLEPHDLPVPPELDPANAPPPLPPL